jgi:hypothetical protein
MRADPAGSPGVMPAPKLIGGAGMTEKLAVISPEGLPQEGARNISRQLDGLDGKIIGEVYNNHFKGELMFRTYRSQFGKKFSNVKVIPFDEFPIVYVGGDPETQKRVAKEVAALAKQRGCDALITGNGG